MRACERVSVCLSVCVSVCLSLCMCVWRHAIDFGLEYVTVRKVKAHCAFIDI